LELLDLWDHEDPLVSVVLQDLKVSKDHLVSLVNLVQLVLLE